MSKYTKIKQAVGKQDTSMSAFVKDVDATVKMIRAIDENVFDHDEFYELLDSIEERLPYIKEYAERVDNRVNNDRII